MTDYYGYPYVALTGGADNALDSLDGSLLKDGDFAVVVVPATRQSYIYTLDADSGATESVPNVIKPDANAGDKRWVLTNTATDAYDVTYYGASSAASAAANLSAFKLAVAAVPTGGKLRVPAQSSFYSIDTSGGLTAAIEIDKRMEIVFEGDVKATTGTEETDPPYMFNVSGDGVKFSGNGSIIGDGTVDDSNTGDESTHPGLIYVTGDNFKFEGPTIDTPPKVGILLYECYNADIIQSTFTGGPTAYTPGDSGYFYVRTYGGGYHAISGNRMIPDGDGGMAVNCIFSNGGTSHLRVLGNVCRAPWEKFTYLYGDYNVVQNNVVTNNTATSAFRFHGSNNKLEGNEATGCLGGVVIYDGAYNEVIGNSFFGITQDGIVVQKLGTYTSGFSGTKIIGNTVIGGTGTKADGIMLVLEGATSNVHHSIVITDNVIESMTDTADQGGIRLAAVSDDSIVGAIVKGNTISSCYNGVVLDRVVDSEIGPNTCYSLNAAGFGVKTLNSGRVEIAHHVMQDPGAYAFHENNSTAIRYIANQSRNANAAGIDGLGNNSYGVLNQYTDAPLVGTLTLTTGNNTTLVAHGGVAPNARIMLQEASSQAGNMLVATGRPITSTANNGAFSIFIPNGANATGNENYFYNIIQ